jgi:IrrE N-terminal-like domain
MNNNTGDLHHQAMELFESALLARRTGDEARTRALLIEALGLESSAADTLAEEYSTEPTRSILYRGAASLALQLGDAQAARRYVEAGLRGHPPHDLGDELTTLREQALTLEALKTDYRLRAPKGLTRVQGIIRKYTGTAPVNIVGLASDLLLSVRQEDLGPDSGEIVRDINRGGFSGYSIVVNVNHSRVRKRFTAAHEVAHFLLHRDRISNRLRDDKMYRSSLGTTKEREANQLAANLLMPRRVIGQFHAAGVRSVEELAEKFNVSIEAMSRRLGK